MRFCSSDAARTTWNAPSKDTALKFADASPMLFTAPALFIISKPQLTDQSVFLASSSVRQSNVILQFDQSARRLLLVKVHKAV